MKVQASRSTATMGSSLPSGNPGILNPFRRNGSGSCRSLPTRLVKFSLLNHGFSFLLCRGVHSSGLLRSLPAKLNAKTEDKVPAAAPQPTKPTYPPWVTWILRTMLSIFLPSWKSQMMTFLKLEEEVEKAVENTAEAVEKVAEMTEKVILEVEKELPADGKLKEALGAIEKAAEEAERDAKIAEKLVHEVHEIKEDVEEFVDPVLKQEEAAELVKKQA